MRSKRKQRLIMVSLILLSSATAVVLALYALSQNINLYYTPTQITLKQAPTNIVIRVGGLVESGTIHFAKQGLTVDFVLTDERHSIPVHFTGVLPDLFRAGQGIVAQGQLNQQGVFMADQVLAKHSASYMPPVVQAELPKTKITQ